MAQRGMTIPLTASAAVTGRRILKMTGSKQAAHAVASNERAFGVAEFDTPAGQPLGVLVTGVVKITAGAAVAAGSYICADAQGRAVAAAPAAGVNAFCIGLAIESAAAAGEEIDVLLGMVALQG